MRTILDVACGTGEHALLLATRHGFEVDGLDLDPALLAIAAAKHPGGAFHEADMTGFELGRRYDAVICLFSSIGYARTIERVAKALTCVERHLAAGGVAVVEPWFPPGVLDPSRVDTRIAESGGVRIERIGRVEVDGRASRIRFDYRIEDELGLREATEIHELGLFTPEEMLGAFASAGLDAEYDPIGLSGRGIYLARRRNDR